MHTTNDKSFRRQPGTTEDWTYKRGDIYLANLNPYKGSEQGGTRPVVVLQNNDGNIYCPTLIVAAVTSQIKKKNQPTHCFFQQIHGLAYPSMVCLEQIKTIDKSRVIRYIGRLTRKQMKMVDEACMESLGWQSRKQLRLRKNSADLNGAAVHSRRR